MPQGRGGQPLHVIGDDVIATFHEGGGARRTHERDATAGPGAGSQGGPIMSDPARPSLA